MERRLANNIGSQSMQVFVSHAEADQPLAQSLTTTLHKAGIQVWNPQESVLPGDNWSLAVGKALEEAEVLVVLITKRSKSASNISREVQFALTSGNYRGRVIPVLVDYVPFQVGSDVPWVLMHMDPVYVTGTLPDFGAVVERVQKELETDAHASA